MYLPFMWITWESFTVSQRRNLKELYNLTNIRLYSCNKQSPDEQTYRCLKFFITHLVSEISYFVNRKNFQIDFLSIESIQTFMPEKQ